MLAFPPDPSLNLGHCQRYPDPYLQLTSGSDVLLVSLHPSHLCCWSPSRIAAQLPSARCPKPRGTHVQDTTTVSAPCHLLGKGVTLGFSGFHYHLAFKDYSPLTFP